MSVPCVLIIAEDADKAQHVREVLGPDGYCFATVANAAEARVWLKDNVASVIVQFEQIADYGYHYVRREEELQNLSLLGLHLTHGAVIIAVGGPFLLEPDLMGGNYIWPWDMFLIEPYDPEQMRQLVRRMTHVSPEIRDILSEGGL